MRLPARTRRPTVLESTYLLLVAAVATVGFSTGSAPTIALAALLALPGSILAVPGYYVAYGLLALVSGANPSRSTGSGWCTPAGDCRTTATGVAGWFTAVTDVVGILALVSAALLNVVVLRRLVARRAAPSRAGRG